MSVHYAWFLRNTHDITPGQVNTAIENELGRSFVHVRSQHYVAYNAIDRAAMALLRWPTRPDSVLELLLYERRR